jgi:hypothetical protein
MVVTGREIPRKIRAVELQVIADNSTNSRPAVTATGIEQQTIIGRAAAGKATQNSESAGGTGRDVVLTQPERVAEKVELNVVSGISKVIYGPVTTGGLSKNAALLPQPVVAMLSIRAFSATAL